VLGSSFGPSAAHSGSLCRRESQQPSITLRLLSASGRRVRQCCAWRGGVGGLPSGITFGGVPRYPLPVTLSRAEPLCLPGLLFLHLIVRCFLCNPGPNFGRTNPMRAIPSRMANDLAIRFGGLGRPVGLPLCPGSNGRPRCFSAVLSADATSGGAFSPDQLGRK
jgi:hypothetical protein